nr:IS66 family transposase [Microbulbifer sp. GL-2]
MDSDHPQVLPKTPLGKAINYCLKYWNGCVYFSTKVI